MTDFRSISYLSMHVLIAAASLNHLRDLWCSVSIVWLGFRGGKGVATALGVQFGLAWQIGGSVALIWLFVARILNTSSLAALVCMALAPLVVLVGE